MPDLLDFELDDIRRELRGVDSGSPRQILLAFIERLDDIISQARARAIRESMGHSRSHGKQARYQA